MATLNAAEKIRYWDAEPVDITACEQECFLLSYPENADIVNVDTKSIIPLMMEVFCQLFKNEKGEVVKVDTLRYGDTLYITGYTDKEYREVIASGNVKPYFRIEDSNDESDILRLTFPVDCFDKNNVLLEITNKNKYKAILDGIKDTARRALRDYIITTGGNPDEVKI